MDIERLKANVHILRLRTGGFLRTGIRLLGIGLVLLVVFNVFGHVIELDALELYPRTERIINGDETDVFLADPVVAAIGAAVAYFL